VGLSGSGMSSQRNAVCCSFREKIVSHNAGARTSIPRQPEEKEWKVARGGGATTWWGVFSVYLVLVSAEEEAGII